ncbi:MAG TPA: thiamine pyrophosphate-binding protein [Burkholderiales bacterium]|nr:thiamine pyrophosphate-binding protein [Burkholderiales bacterium]
MNTPAWPDALYEELLAAGVKQVAYVPDAGHRRLIELAHANHHLKAVVLTTEEEGIGLAVGAYLGGERSVLLLQSSGVGNCINALSLPAECRIPLLMLITMRGEFGEFNPWQIAMGQGTRPALEAMRVIVYRVDDAERVVETARAAATVAFETGRSVAVLLGQRLIGAKVFRK